MRRELDKDFPACPTSVSRHWFNIRVVRAEQMTLFSQHVQSTL